MCEAPALIAVTRHDTKPANSGTNRATRRAARAKVLQPSAAITLQTALAESSPISPRAPWVRVIAAHGLLWTLAALPYAGMLVAEAMRQSAEPRYLAALGQAVATLLPWAICSVGLHAYLMRHAERWTLARLLAAYAIAMLLFVLPQEVFQAWLIKWLQGAALPSPTQVLTQLTPFYWLADATLLVATLAGVLGWLAYQRHQEGLERRHAAETALAASRLQIESLRLASLQAQLEPHFLFNALNAIAGLVRAREHEQALSALAGVSDLLRHAVRATQRTWATLGDEIEFLRAYLDVQQLRFGERLRVQWSVADAALGFPCPPLVLQPLVENAIRHGIEALPEPGQLRIELALDGDCALIKIGNSRPSHPASPGFGIGQSNTRERLALLYAGGATLDVHDAADWYQVTLRLPEPADD